MPVVKERVFTFPQLAAGDFVLFKNSPSHNDWYPMRVLLVGNDSIDGIVEALSGEAVQGKLVFGCRHVHDPIWRDPEMANNLVADGDSGCFIQHPTALRTAARFAALEARLADLETRVTGGNTPRKPAPKNPEIERLRETLEGTDPNNALGGPMNPAPWREPKPEVPIEERAEAVDDEIEDESDQVDNEGEEPGEIA